MNIYKSLFKLLLSVFLCSSSAIALIYIKHQSRELFIELEALKTDRDQFNIEWSELRSEENKWAIPARVEQQAIEYLNLQKPSIEKMNIYKKQ
ncbi:MAG TPA: cell division protein FtsL [Woeseiaceae bacterium]|jgi:cell division protein FtsL|nr:cell division protein FtsL [Woeseiaceae bacterium]|tara:strand:- start:1097 stop:1375 length:279 start_codon:yes stop_codon:yes gene_type:complete